MRIPLPALWILTLVPTLLTGCEAQTPAAKMGVGLVINWCSDRRHHPPTLAPPLVAPLNRRGIARLRSRNPPALSPLGSDSSILRFLIDTRQNRR